MITIKTEIIVDFLPTLVDMYNALVNLETFNKLNGHRNTSDVRTARFQIGRATSHSHSACRLQHYLSKKGLNCILVSPTDKSKDDLKLMYNQAVGPLPANTIIYSGKDFSGDMITWNGRKVPDVVIFDQASLYIDAYYNAGGFFGNRLDTNCKFILIQ